MFYEKVITVPLLTYPTDPVIEIIPVHPGVLTLVEVVFPAGCVGLVHLTLNYWERQVFPSNPDASFSGDDVAIRFNEDIEINEPPFEFKAVAWNYDDTYTHNVTVRLQITPHDRTIGNVLSTIIQGRTNMLSLGRA